MKKIFFSLCVLFAVSLGARCAFFYFSYSDAALIAHAGGAIDGYTYTNSLEAIVLAQSNGFRFIELDLHLSSDGHIIALHDWKEFHKITDGEGEEPISLDEFNSKKIYGKYTPLDANSISLFFNKHPELILFTDKISDFDAMLSQLHINPERLRVETFSVADYDKAIRKGIPYPMLCIWNKEQLDAHIELLREGKVSKITIPTSLLAKHSDIIASLYKNGVTVFVFGTDKNKYIKKYLGTHVTGFYVDSLTNKSLRYYYWKKLTLSPL